jgi:hypothetical protein
MGQREYFRTNEDISLEKLEQAANILDQNCILGNNDPHIVAFILAKKSKSKSAFQREI